MSESGGRYGVTTLWDTVPIPVASLISVLHDLGRGVAVRRVRLREESRLAAGH